MKIFTSYPRVIRFVCTNLIIIAAAFGFSGCRNNSLSYMVPTRQVMMFDQLQQDTSLTLVVQAFIRTNLSSTLDTYGPYTFFAPDNNAFRQYIINKGKTSLNDFTNDQLKTILLYLIVPTRLYSSSFVQGPQSVASGSGDFLTLDISKGYRYNTIANGIAHVYQTDIVYSNGLVDIMDAVLDPPVLTIGQFLSANPSQYSVMTAGLKRAGLLDTLTALNDVNGNRIALTLFAETNSVLQAAGISTFDNMPLSSLQTLMKDHIIKGGNFSSSYTPHNLANPGIDKIERWDSTITTLDTTAWIYFNLADTKLINGSTVGLSASDVLMRNGVLHNVDTHMVFDTTINSSISKRTQIVHVLNGAISWAYGVTGVSSTTPPPYTTVGNWRIYTETGTGTSRGSINCLFFSPHAVNDSLITIVKNVRRGKYRIELNFKGNSGSRGNYQLMYQKDLIGVPNFYGGTPTWEQKLFVGNYTFQTSGNKRLKFVCDPSRFGSINLDCIVLTPTN